MKVSEFAKKYKFSNKDKNIVEKLYAQEDKTEQEWDGLLKEKIAYKNPAEASVNEAEVVETAEEEVSDSDENKDVPSKEQKIEEGKNKNKKQ